VVCTTSTTGTISTAGTTGTSGGTTCTTGWGIGRGVSRGFRESPVKFGLLS